jgi:hypothetical protein
MLFAIIGASAAATLVVVGAAVVQLVSEVREGSDALKAYRKECWFVTKEVARTLYRGLKDAGKLLVTSTPGLAAAVVGFECLALYTGTTFTAAQLLTLELAGTATLGAACLLASFAMLSYKCCFGENRDAEYCFVSTDADTKPLSQQYRLVWPGKLVGLLKTTARATGSYLWASIKLAGSWVATPFTWTWDRIKSKPGEEPAKPKEEAEVSTQLTEAAAEAAAPEKVAVASPAAPMAIGEARLTERAADGSEKVIELSEAETKLAKEWAEGMVAEANAGGAAPLTAAVAKVAEKPVKALKGEPVVAGKKKAASEKTRGEIGGDLPEGFAGASV